MEILAKGESMFPTLLDNHAYEVIIKDEYTCGDIVVFKYMNIYICHRIIKVIKNKRGDVFFKPKGDNCEKYDDFVVLPSMVIGKINI